ncbi:hypothetical protein ACN27F_14610 [Solwaraspora sp. WMMB335]|uniref:hypothetical protein n=1 Tax=Solwaraspora sp. WMMB335 TaxID=3404118 RepID=UPI003B95A84D
MATISDEALAAIGRLTVAMTDLEFTLAWIGADQEGGDQGKVFAKPGEAVRAARGSVEFAPAAYREAFLEAVGDAGRLLAQGHAAIRALWLGSSDDEAAIDVLTLRSTKIRQPVEPALLNNLTVQLQDCRARLDSLLNALLSDRRPTSAGREPIRGTEHHGYGP